MGVWWWIQTGMETGYKISGTRFGTGTEIRRRNLLGRTKRDLRKEIERSLKVVKVMSRVLGAGMAGGSEMWRRKVGGGVGVGGYGSADVVKLG